MPNLQAVKHPSILGSGILRCSRRRLQAVQRYFLQQEVPPYLLSLLQSRVDLQSSHDTSATGASEKDKHENPLDHGKLRSRWQMFAALFLVPSLPCANPLCRSASSVRHPVRSNSISLNGVKLSPKTQCIAVPLVVRVSLPACLSCSFRKDTCRPACIAITLVDSYLIARRKAQLQPSVSLPTKTAGPSPFACASAQTGPAASPPFQGHLGEGPVPIAAA